MKINARVVINTGLYQHIEIEIPLEVPDELKNEALVAYLHTKYKGFLDRKEKVDAEQQKEVVLCANCGCVMERKTFDWLCSEDCRKEVKYKLESRKKTK